jgi:hypothetical protein
MKRFGQALSWLLLGSVFVGCGGGGIEEGMPKEAQGGQTPEAKAFIEANRKNMTSLKQGKPKNIEPPATKE